MNRSVIKEENIVLNHDCVNSQAFRLSHDIHVVFNFLTFNYPLKGALTWYGKLTWESAHAWNLIILCHLIV